MAAGVLGDKVQSFLGVIGVTMERDACSIRLGGSGFFPKAGYFALQIASLSASRLSSPAVENLS